MKVSPQAPCYCGRGCTDIPGGSITDPRVRSERDAVAKYLALHGPMPVYAEMAEGAWAAGERPEPLYWIESLDDPRIGKPVPAKRGKAQVDEEPDPVARARMAEALAWIAAYRGSWGLPLDIRADRRWGTKYMRLSARQVDVILAARDRDAARATEAVADPRQAEAREYLQSIPNEDLLRDAARGSGLRSRWPLRQPQVSDRQLEAINSCRARRTERTRTVSTPVTEIGIYRHEGVVYKVQAARSTGHLYAKRLTVFGPGSATFEFEQGAIRKLRPEDRLTVEQAAEFGHQFGVCAVCGAQLTDPESVQRGIGPICASKV